VEPSPLAFELLTANRRSLGTQLVDHHLAISRDIHRVDDAAQWPTRVLLAASSLMVVEETVFSSVAQSVYAVCAAMHEVLSSVIPSFKSCYIRFAELHLSFVTALLAMGTAHLTYEYCGIVKAWGRPTSDQSLRECEPAARRALPLPETAVSMANIEQNSNSIRRITASPRDRQTTGSCLSPLGGKRGEQTFRRLLL